MNRKLNPQTEAQTQRNGLHRTLFFALLFLGTLFIVSSAHATNSANIKLAVVVQYPAIENPAGVFTHDVIKYKLTNKEMLILLNGLYPGASTAGNALTINDGGTQFFILYPNGTLQAISTSHLELYGYGAIKNGISNAVTGTVKIKLFGPGSLTLLLNASNHFILAGGVRGLQTPSWSVLCLLAGEGKLAGGNTYLSGTVLVRFAGS